MPLKICETIVSMKRDWIGKVTSPHCFFIAWLHIWSFPPQVYELHCSCIITIICDALSWVFIKWHIIMYSPCFLIDFIILLDKISNMIIEIKWTWLLNPLFHLLSVWRGPKNKNKWYEYPCYISFMLIFLVIIVHIYLLYVQAQII